jgi:hypothetical protein
MESLGLQTTQPPQPQPQAVTSAVVPRCLCPTRRSWLGGGCGCQPALSAAAASRQVAVRPAAAKWHGSRSGARSSETLKGPGARALAALQRGAALQPCAAG